MDPVIISVLLAFATLYCVVLLVSRLFKRRVKYIDTGKSSVFVSKRYKIAAKPDLIQDNKTLVEKKSRRTGVYDSDRKQLIATALAVRSVHPIRSGFVETQTDREEVDLAGSDKSLFRLIKTEYKNALLINAGKKPPAYPSYQKCRHCQFRSDCEHSAYNGR